jgi:putative endonuclease
VAKTPLPGKLRSAREIAVHYVYVLHSESDRMFYTGCTADLKARLEDHSAGRVPATKLRRPLRLVYYEASDSALDAFRRERYLKTSYGKRYLKNRLRAYFTG